MKNLDNLGSEPKHCQYMVTIAQLCQWLVLWLCDVADHLCLSFLKNETEVLLDLL